MWRDDALFLDMLLAAEDALRFTSGLDWSAFQSSDLHQSAVIRAIGVLGEAASKVSAEAQQAHPEIPWREIVGMRHRLIHGYREVRLDIVWDVVQNRLPPPSRRSGRSCHPTPPRRIEFAATVRFRTDRPGIWQYYSANKKLPFGLSALVRGQS